MSMEKPVKLSKPAMFHNYIQGDFTKSHLRVFQDNKGDLWGVYYIFSGRNAILIVIKMVSND